MANQDAPFGLRPIRHRNGAPYNGAAQPYYVDSGYATALFIGDPVVRVAGGSNAAEVEGYASGVFPIGTLPSVEKASAGDGNAITGVIVGVDNGHDINSGGVYLPASTGGIVWVADDPDLVFEIQADGAISATQVGLNAVLIYTNSGDTNTGLSGAELDTTSDVPAADASNQLRICRVVNRTDNEAASANTVVEVTINAHTEAHGALGI